MTKKTTQKTKWFYTEFKQDTKAVILLAPGLNLLPSKMDQLALFFNSKKCDVLRIALPNNPEDWTDKFSDLYNDALEHAEILNRPLYFVGFSLGALLGVHYLLRHTHHQFKSLVLIAPATHTHFYTRIPAFFGNFFPKIKLPSFNLPDYRQRENTSLLEYKKMHQLQTEIQNEIKNKRIETPTLVVLNPKDELIDSSTLTKFAHLNPHWKVLSISNSGSLLPRKYHHLMIDPEAIGANEWEKLLKNLTAHLSL